jgi:signal peptidase I
MDFEKLNSKEIKQLQKGVDKRNETLAGASFYRLVDFILYSVFVLLLALAIRAVVFEPVRVDGPSMNYTLENNDYMLVDKLGYAFSPPKRGDVVILFYPNQTENTYVKRVIGLPGDTVRIEQGRIYINDELINESYLSVELSGNHDGVYIVPEDEIFVMGDNRPISLDSTRVGTMKIERVIGRVRAILFPLKNIKLIKRPSYK